MEAAKYRHLAIVGQGFLLWQGIHILGSILLFPFLSQRYPEIPQINVASLVSTDIAPIFAIYYMSLRLDGWSPKLNVGYDSVRGAIGGIVLVWLGMFVALVFFDRENIYAKSILALPAPYQYHAVFSLVIWSPLLEEILARGYFFELLHKEGNPFFALVLSTALFVVPHGIWGEWGAGLVLITFSSIVCTFAYTQGGIWAAAVTHVFANGFILFLNWQI